MQVEISEMDFQIAASLLADYVEEKQQQLASLQQQFNREYVAQRETDLHAWLLNYSKQLAADVLHLHEGAREFYTEIKMPFLYTFYEQCLGILTQNGKHLAQALAERINRCIDFAPDPSSITAKINTIIASTQRDEKTVVEKGKGLTGRDLESLDYFLNLLSYEDSKSYEEYKSHCDRLLLQRQSFENIQASQASRQILETANCIHDIMEDTDKVFQESYLAKYMEFKSYLTQLPRPDQLHSIFKEEMEKATKLRFFEGMARAILTLARVGRDQQKKQVTSSFVQTVEEVPKYRAQEKLQGLLLQQKRNNQKLSYQLQKLKRNSSSSFEDRGELQKKLEKEETTRKQFENKYKILENLYNAKCTDEQRQKGKKTANSKENDRKTSSMSVQVGECCLSKSMSSQTDSDFYYYFQSTKIAELQKRTDELQKLLSHKEYVLQEMQAIKTFRDNFKSKKEIYSTQVKTQKNISLGKSLHYLQEDDEIYDEKEEMRNGKSSVDEGKVNTPVDHAGKNQYVFRKKNQKKTEMIKNKPYFAFNDKIDDKEEDQHLSKSQHEQNHQISLRSILKMGNNTFKVDKGIQTESIKAQAALQSATQSKNERSRYNERDAIKEKMRETVKINIRQSQSSQNSKSIREKIQPVSKEARKSNFISFQNLNEPKKTIESDIVVPANQTFTGRQSPFVSTLNRKMTPDKPKYLMRLSKWNEAKVNTLNNEVLHVNNSLNLNFFQPLSTSPKISVPKAQRGKSIAKEELIAKPKKLKRIL